LGDEVLGEPAGVDQLLPGRAAVDLRHPPEDPERGQVEQGADRADAGHEPCQVAPVEAAGTVDLRLVGPVVDRRRLRQVEAHVLHEDLYRQHRQEGRHRARRQHGHHARSARASLTPSPR
jgi:hypothetical protein